MSLDRHDMLEGIRILRRLAADRDLYANVEYGPMAYEIQQNAAYHAKRDGDAAYEAAYGASSQALLLLRGNVSWDSERSLCDRVVEYADMAIGAFEADMVRMSP